MHTGQTSFNLLSLGYSNPVLPLQIGPMPQYIQYTHTVFIYFKKVFVYLLHLIKIIKHFFILHKDNPRKYKMQLNRGFHLLRKKSFPNLPGLK